MQAEAVCGVARFFGAAREMPAKFADCAPAKCFLQWGPRVLLARLDALLLRMKGCAMMESVLRRACASGLQRGAVVLTFAVASSPSAANAQQLIIEHDPRECAAGRRHAVRPD